MKLIFENWRKFVNEEADNENEDGIRDISAKIFSLHIIPRQKEFFLNLSEEDMKKVLQPIIDEVKIMPPEDLVDFAMPNKEEDFFPSDYTPGPRGSDSYFGTTNLKNAASESRFLLAELMEQASRQGAGAGDRGDVVDPTQKEPEIIEHPIPNFDQVVEAHKNAIEFLKAGRAIPCPEGNCVVTQIALGHIRPSQAEIKNHKKLKMKSRPRKGSGKDFIVIHVSDTYHARSTTKVLSGKGLGTHFEVTKDGVGYHYVGTDNYTSHAGYGFNKNSIGIDLTQRLGKRLKGKNKGESLGAPYGGWQNFNDQLGFLEQLIGNLCNDNNIPQVIAPWDFRTQIRDILSGHLGTLEKEDKYSFENNKLGKLLVYMEEAIEPEFFKRLGIGILPHHVINVNHECPGKGFPVEKFGEVLTGDTLKSRIDEIWSTPEQKMELAKTFADRMAENYEIYAIRIDERKQKRNLKRRYAQFEKYLSIVEKEDSPEAVARARERATAASIELSMMRANDTSEKKIVNKFLVKKKFDDIDIAAL
jgi:hypothetical protein